MLNSPNMIRDITALNNDELTIHIGEDDNEMEDVAVISAKVKVPGHKEGSIAILGPRRMDYAKVINYLEYVVETLEKHFEDQNEKQDELENNKEVGEEWKKN